MRNGYNSLELSIAVHSEVVNSPPGCAPRLNRMAYPPLTEWSYAAGAAIIVLGIIVPLSVMVGVARPIECTSWRRSIYGRKDHPAISLHASLE